LEFIRIKMPFATTYEPTLEVHGTEASVCAKYNHQTHEVTVRQLDPRDSIYVVIFLSNEEAEAFQEPTVIIENKLLSRGMRAVGYIKRRPKEILLMVLVLLTPLIAAAVLAYAVLGNTTLNPRVRAVQKAMQGYVGCVPKAYKQSEATDSILSKSMLGEAAMLQMNHVSNLQQLHHKKYVVVCIAR
jgi:hypothetical protein